MRSLRAVFITFGFLIVTLPLMPVQWLMQRLDLKTARTFPHRYHRFVCWLLGVSVKVEGQRPAASGLLVSNHTSWLDIPVISSVLPVSFIAKQEVGRWPLFGSLARLQNSVFVNRKARVETGQSRNEIAKRVKQGDTVVLFAEGTSGNGRIVKSFKSSLFGAVEGLISPVMPVTLVYHSQHGLPLTLRQRPSIAWYGDMDLMPHLWEIIKSGPIRVTVKFHNSLPASGRKAMSANAESLIRSTLAEALHAPAKMG